MLSRKQQEGLRHLGRWLETRARWAAPAAVLAFSFSPIPSNELFIAAGLAEIKLWPIVAAFFVGRVVSYYVLALGAHAAVDRLEDAFSVSGQGVAALVIQLAALGLLVVLAKIDWVKLLHLPETPLTEA